ncbi:ketosteroid isomerase family protein [Ruegeria sp. THAF33]|uniref:YybH family protein n=1 Tax=Ruegeria sp. THAF33 TaxID=2587853 RepID=UPI001268623B|nr:nuclear transport factor 2 family protein [Ruegeria sp. THAF33]QFT74836.1 hypothetical protein FIU92_17500 [Ruegeria sp. THAF33]
MRHLSLTLAAMLVAFTAWAEDAPRDVQAELLAFNDRFNALAADYDVEGLVGLYADTSLWISPDTRPVPGQQGASEVFSFMSAQQATNLHSVDVLEVSEDGTLAMMVGNADISIPSMNVEFTGTLQFVMRWSDGEWRILSDMYNVHEG